jgi:microsomal dipeptidase-like Zn-dependent dipeptidase
MLTVAQGLEDQGFANADIEKIMGQNWLGFFEKSFPGTPS